MAHASGSGVVLTGEPRDATRMPKTTRTSPALFFREASADTKEWSGGPPSSHASVVVFVSDLSLPPRGTTTRV